MKYTLNHSSSTYHIKGDYKKYLAGNDIALVMEVIGKLNKSIYINRLDERSDGLYVCWGTHMGAGSSYVKVISYDTQTSHSSILKNTTADTILTNTVTSWPPPGTTIVPDYNWNPSPQSPFMPIPSIEPQPVTGWICPKCGNGVSPYTSICPCNHKVTITC